MKRIHGLEADLLNVGLERADTVFADGQAANNKWNLDYATLLGHPVLLRTVVVGLADLAEPYEPEFVAGIPNGATGIAACVANELSYRYDTDVYHVHLRKNGDASIAYADDIDEITVGCLNRGILVEDVFNRGSTTEKALQLPGLNERTAAVLAIAQRTVKADQGRIEKPVKSLVTRQIPPKLHRYSRLWKYASK